jgi:hypothetical protein
MEPIDSELMHCVIATLLAPIWQTTPVLSGVAVFGGTFEAGFQWRATWSPGGTSIWRVFGPMENDGRFHGPKNWEPFSRSAIALFPWPSRHFLARLGFRYTAAVRSSTRKANDSVM